MCDGVMTDRNFHSEAGKNYLIERFEKLGTFLTDKLGVFKNNEIDNIIYKSCSPIQYLN